MATRRGRLGIGDVIKQLSADFPDISISKVRFLEYEGLVEPARTPSGYRKFSRQDLDRLRYILTAQRDQYLPLKVIREHLDAIDRGLEPPKAAGESPKAPRPNHQGSSTPSAADFRPRRSRLRMSRAELLASAGLEEDVLEQLESFGLVAAGREHYDDEALAIATTVSDMASYGFEPRHLRAFKTAAEREVGLIEQVVVPISRRRSADAKDRAEAAVNQLAALSVQLHAALVKAALHRPR